MRVLVKSKKVEVAFSCFCRNYDPTGGRPGDSCTSLCVGWCPTQSTHCSTTKAGMAPQSIPTINA